MELRTKEQRRWLSSSNILQSSVAKKRRWRSLQLGHPFYPYRPLLPDSSIACFHHVKRFPPLKQKHCGQHKRCPIIKYRSFQFDFHSSFKVGVNFYPRKTRPSMQLVVQCEALSSMLSCTAFLILWLLSKPGPDPTGRFLFFSHVCRLRTRPVLLKTKINHRDRSTLCRVIKKD